MSKHPHHSLIRPATAADVGVISQLIRELAAYEKLTHAVDATPEQLTDAFFGSSPRVFCDLAEHDGNAVGFAVWFYNFSTFRGRPGIYLEDLFVRPAFRGEGLGKALLRNLARRCVAEKLVRLEWSVLDWNTPAIAFYENQGAVLMDEWTTFRLSDAALGRFGSGV